MPEGKRKKGEISTNALISIDEIHRDNFDDADQSKEKLLQANRLARELQVQQAINLEHSNWANTSVLLLTIGIICFVTHDKALGLFNIILALAMILWVFGWYAYNFVRPKFFELDKRKYNLLYVHPITTMVILLLIVADYLWAVIITAQKF